MAPVLVLLRRVLRRGQAQAAPASTQAPGSGCPPVRMPRGQGDEAVGLDGELAVLGEHRDALDDVGEQTEHAEVLVVFLLLLRVGFWVRVRVRVRGSRLVLVVVLLHQEAKAG